MTRRLALFLLCLSCVASAQSTPPAGFVALTASRIQGATGGPLSSGTLNIQPTDGSNNPITASAGGVGGQITTNPIAIPVTNGAIPSGTFVADTALTRPANISFRLTIRDATGTAISTLKLVQPSSVAGSSWCSTASGVTTCNLDAYQPNVLAQAVVEVGPTGQPGPPGSNGPLAFTGVFVTAGDSLEDGHNLSGFVSPGYPNAPPAGAWPEVLATLPVFQTGVTVYNTNVDGYTLSQMASAYTAAVRPHSPMVTGSRAILAISIYGNDAAAICPSGCTYTLASYEAAYASYVATARADGFKVMFLAQWAQTGRQQYDSTRLAFNEWNRQNVDMYLDFTGRMNTPANLALYQSDGLHANAEGHREIAAMAQQAILSGGTTTNYGNAAYENPGNPSVVTVSVAASDGLVIRNLASDGYSSFVGRDASGTDQISVGYASPGAAYFADTVYFNSHSKRLQFCNSNGCNMQISPNGQVVISETNSNLDAAIIQNISHTGYSSIQFKDEFGVPMLTVGYSNAGASFIPGNAYFNSQSPTGSAYVCGFAQCTFSVHPDGSIGMNAVQQGPATAPAGSCSILGWEFTQDGHATFCNGTTWVTKI